MRILLDESVPGRLDLLLTADKGFEHQQNLSDLPLAVVIVVAISNRMEHLAPLAPAILRAVANLPPKTLRKVCD